MQDANAVQAGSGVHFPGATQEEGKWGGESKKDSAGDGRRLGQAKKGDGEAPPDDPTVVT